MSGIEDRLLELARHLYEAIGWPGVVVLMAVESACIPFPSEVIMPLAGWFLVKERGLGAEWLLVAGLYGALGNLAGSMLAYVAGAWAGRPFLERYGRYLLITPGELALADRFFRRHGEASAFFSRLLPVVRTFISLPAGVARADPIRFAVFTFLGSFPWCLGLAAAGYLLGEHWQRLMDWFRPVSLPLAALLALAVILYYGRRLREAFGRGAEGRRAAVEEVKE
ncbi:MAG: DedA family protein [Dehalococcoidia bacterium]|jgi:membrane protein DedA with SNARE-associated domain|nr:DedA family protein [Dehalococcoidia bacterium]MDW8009511.1 DedA family protein [Chloroflexota bacterium]